MSIVRYIVAILLSLFVFFLMVTIFDRLAGQVSALPAPQSLDEYKRNLHLYPSTFFLTLMSGWTVAAFSGTSLAAWLAPKHKSWIALGIGLVGLSLTILNLCLIPHPAWIWIGVVPMAAVVFLVATWFRKPTPS
jgi:hypothetical protein